MFCSVKNHSTLVAMTPLYTDSQCYTQRFCRMDYYPGLLPISESENEMADKGMIIEELLPVGVTFHKAKVVTTDKINNCHI